MKKWNKKGQRVFIGIMVAIMVFITAVVLITPIKYFINEARGADKLDCDNTSIPTSQAAACIIADMTLFYYFGVMIGIGVAFIIGKRALEIG